jgi:hypothetical protein
MLGVVPPVTLIVSPNFGLKIIKAFVYCIKFAYFSFIFGVLLTGCCALPSQRFPPPCFAPHLQNKCA